MYHNDTIIGQNSKCPEPGTHLNEQPNDNQLLIVVTEPLRTMLA